MAKMPDVIKAAHREKVTALDAMAEVEREMEVRSRIYQKWADDGRLPWATAVKQYAAMTKALLLCKEAVEIDNAERETFVPEIINDQSSGPVVNDKLASGS